MKIKTNPFLNQGQAPIGGMAGASGNNPDFSALLARALQETFDDQTDAASAAGVGGNGSILKSGNPYVSSETIQSSMSQATATEAANQLAGLNNADDKKLRTACQELESVFINMLLTQMRATVPKPSLLGQSHGEDIMRSMLDTEMSRKLSQNGGIGLADMLYKQLTRDQKLAQEQPHAVAGPSGAATAEGAKSSGQKQAGSSTEGQDVTSGSGGMPLADMLIQQFTAKQKDTTPAVVDTTEIDAKVAAIGGPDLAKKLYRQFLVENMTGGKTADVATEKIDLTPNVVSDAVTDVATTDTGLSPEGTALANQLLQQFMISQAQSMPTEKEIDAKVAAMDGPDLAKKLYKNFLMDTYRIQSTSTGSVDKPEKPIAAGTVNKASVPEATTLGGMELANTLIQQFVKQQETMRQKEDLDIQAKVAAMDGPDLAKKLYGQFLQDNRQYK